MASARAFAIENDDRRLRGAVGLSAGGRIRDSPFCATR